MAQSDLTALQSGRGTAITAADNIKYGVNAVDVDAAAKAAAAAAGVSSAAFINYSTALTNYNNRPDVEPLLNRRARDVGTTFAATNFARSSTPGGSASGI